ncbi:MAG: hypothetical protein J6F30_15610 [Cellulosilyticum sp.]|nr:hypothetical protein [Cellulosilyticum sp.]
MLGMKLRFNWMGFIIFMLPMLINFVYFALARNTEQPEQGMVSRGIELIEQGTRILYAILICLLVSQQKVDWKSPLFYGAVAFLILYYIVWIRYFMGGMEQGLMTKSFLFIPIPLAVFPVLYYLLSAIWLHNCGAAIVMVIFGVAHNIVSRQAML